MLLLPALFAAHAGPCEDYDAPEPIIEFDAGVEASGLAASALRPGVFFTHGDKDDPRILVSFDADGLLEEHEIHNASNRDWEDIASATCPNPVDGNCLYIGDIGGSVSIDDEVDIYVVREPIAGDNHLTPVEIWEAELPEPSDAEALLVHPVTGAVTLITKEHGRSRVLRLSADHTTFEEVEELDPSMVTGGAWDPTGERLVLRNGDELFVWDTDPLDPDGHWNNDPLELDEDSGERGEAVTFAPDGELYSLGSEQPLLEARFPCIPPEPEEEPDENERRAGSPPLLGCQAVPGSVFGGVLLLVTGRRGKRRLTPRQ